MIIDKIEKQTILRTTLSRAWQAISNADEFGSWFGVEFDGPFVAGQTITGRITPTKVDPEVAASQEPYKGMAFTIEIDRIEPEHLFSFRWHPFAIDPNVDYSQEPCTLITFTLKETSDGVLLKLTEAGFDQIPLDRRAEAFKSDEGGWEAQMTLVAKYVENGG